MKKKGFTLVELLAVIVILAIIAVIATPIILGVIEKSKKGAAENSALGYTEAVEKQIARNLLDEDATNDITDGVYGMADLTSKEVKVKGDTPIGDSWVEIEKKQVVDYSLKIGNYVVNYNETETVIDIITKDDILTTMNYNILDDDYELTTNELTNILIIELQCYSTGI